MADYWPLTTDAASNLYFGKHHGEASKGEAMRTRALALMIAALAFMMVAPASAKNKKKQSHRGMLESMQSLPCGVKEHGITGFGGLWASVGVQHVQSDEKLCPQYLFRTDEMDYHIRPVDMKHAGLLPVGQEGEFKIKKNFLYLKIGDKKARPYRVVSMEPNKPQSATESTSYTPVRRPAPPEYRPQQGTPNRQASTQAGSPPPQ
jgi:hypothetical protein